MSKDIPPDRTLRKSDPIEFIDVCPACDTGEIIPRKHSEIKWICYRCGYEFHEPVNRRKKKPYPDEPYTENTVKWRKVAPVLRYLTERYQEEGEFYFHCKDIADDLDSTPKQLASICYVLKNKPPPIINIDDWSRSSGSVNWRVYASDKQTNR